MSYERKLMLRHSLASIVALAIFGASRFIYSVVISRKFGVEILGRANSLISQAFLLAIPLSFFAVALGKYTSEFLAKAEKEKIKSITTIGFAFPFVGICLIPFNLFLGVIALLRAFQLTFRSFIYGLHRGEVYAYVMCVSFLFFIGGFLFENYYAPYIDLLLVIAISGFIYLFKNKLLGKPNFEDFKLLTRYSSFAFLGTLSGVFLVQAPYFLSEKFAGSIVAGVVSASLSSAFLLTYLPQVFQSAIMPLYSYKYGKSEMNYVKWLAEESTKMLSLFVAFIVFILIVVGRELLSVLFGFTLGNEFYLALMAVETYIAYNPSIVALNSTQYVREGTFVAIFGAIISLVSWLTLIKPFEEYGAVLGLLLGYLTILLMTAWISYKNIGISPRSYLPFVLAVSVQGLIFISKILFFIGFLAYLLGVKEEIKRALELFRAYI
ncbi:lipopolysaccharide biosynthesis protein [Thermococcus argininiproducens]|uniref:Lipopolysaccharide biosynthesis protein n=1 Tax=Thermococcus argininiproducens TaxID=2866384 RepID=A0A9E7SDI6_9EURY|nr:lipopolysaccharide biosynthesis protein [Thermococcus argininiproducens]USH00805.1 lipopolysaccharide biosynthesis protein [Thermococcus argininiproducens]